MHRRILGSKLGLLALLMLSAAGPQMLHAADKPNIIFILADDMGCGDLGCYGQKLIQTPRLDRMAAEGLRFTQGYCGTSVCAPSRCVLLTGQHSGHTFIRGNKEVQPEGQAPIPADSQSVAQLLKQAGYATGCIGKWGLGFVGTSGDPLSHGFDYFFGYNCQRQAHSYYPNHLWRNDERIPLDGKTYSHDLLAADALRWVREKKDGPFFLYLAFTAPHETIAVPELEPYAKDQLWAMHEKVYASIISRMDRDIGRLLDLLRELKLADNTLVIFASDNGQDMASSIKQFHCNGDLRGIKRTMYEGGLREPFIAWWPGTIAPKSTCDEPVAFFDFLPTAVELSGQKLPAGVKTDGFSLQPALLGRPLPQREFLYWELEEKKFVQAVRLSHWKGVRNGVTGPVELYDLSTDQRESQDVAAAHPDVVRRIDEILHREHVPSPLWPNTVLH